MKYVKIIGKSLENFTSFIRNIAELWHNEKIEVIRLDQVPFRQIVRVWVPAQILEDRVTLTLISSMKVS